MRIPVKRASHILLFLLSASVLAAPKLAAQARTVAPGIQSMDACGDSITKAYNGQGAFPCPFTDQEQYNWATSDTHGARLCWAGPEGVFSQAERLECQQGKTLAYIANPNAAVSGADMLHDFANQANLAKSRLSNNPGPRFVPVLMGHNDLCGGTVWKYNFSCAAGSDQDRFNYCRTTPAAFEREFRKGLDILITTPDTHIGVASMVRVSQLCNHGSKQNCAVFTNCQRIWTEVAYLGWIFGRDNGICGSLTVDCSDERVRDAYLTAQQYRDVLQRVSGEYSLVRPGSPSPVVFIAGQTVGGAVKATGVTMAYSDATWKYRFTSSQLNCCDCFHPSPSGQNAAARILFNGLTCRGQDDCCQDTGNPDLDGKCLVTDKRGTFYPGFFSASQ